MATCGRRTTPHPCFKLLAPFRTEALKAYDRSPPPIFGPQTTFRTALFRNVQKATGRPETGQICTVTRTHGKQLFVTVQINGQTMKAMIDSGANVNAISPQAALECRLHITR